MTLRIAALAVTLAALAVPASAAAHDGERAPCPQLTAPRTERPACPAAPDAAAEKAPATGDDATGTDAGDAGTEPVRKPKRAAEDTTPGELTALTRRTWRFSGEANGFADGVLSATIDKVAGLSKRAARRLGGLLGEQALVLVGPRTRVVSADGERLTGDEAAAALDAADAVRVTGKLLAKAAWRTDEDGEAVPTVRAARVEVR